MSSDFQTGLEHCLSEPPAVLRHARLGLLMNQASVSETLGYSSDLLATRFPKQLVSIFSPQHGIWGEQQANMIETSHTRHAELEIPVYSLYSETRRPTAAMLADLDCLVIDLQDVGTRVYTFIWTMLECIRACSESGKTVVVLDRPNPLGGQTVEGPLLENGFESFVGNACIPMRHGLTMAELARWFVHEFQIDVELHVVPMRGWRRNMFFEASGRRWLWPSPNMPSVSTTIVYPGQVLLEGTLLSEGRGTTRPFEVAGAPYIDAREWVTELNRLAHPGLVLRPLYFCPTFDKWQGHSCGGVDWQIIDPQKVRSVQTTVGLIACAASLYAEHFAWLEPPYEYEFHKPPIDILFGSARLREYVQRVVGGLAVAQADIDDLVRFDVLAWHERTRAYWLYDQSSVGSFLPFNW